MQRSWKKTDIFRVGKRFHIGRAFRQPPLVGVCESSKMALAVFEPKNVEATRACVGNFVHFVVFVAFSFVGVCVDKVFHMNEENFPHCLWKQSVKSLVPVVPLSFLSNRCKTLLRKHLFILFSRNIFFHFI